MTRLLIPAAILAALALPAMASANNPSASADCTALVFTMPAGIAGTVVTATDNGRVIFTDTIATQGDSSGFRHPSTSQTISHAYVVLVDAPFDNVDQRFAFDVGPCVTTTTPAPTVSTTSTTVPPPSSTTTPTSTTAPTVVTSVPSPSTSSTIVVSSTLRPTTPATTAPTFTLPETGRDVSSPLIAAAVAVLLGAAAIFGGRRWAS